MVRAESPAAEQSECDSSTRQLVDHQVGRLTALVIEKKPARCAN